MKTMQNANYVPQGWHSVTPRVVVHDSKQLVEFIKHVFDATGDYRTDRPSIISIGDSKIMISDAGVRDPSPAFLYVYVKNADQTFQRAIQFGAISVEEPTETPYGDRRAMIKDKWDNIWQIATYNQGEKE